MRGWVIAMLFLGITVGLTGCGLFAPPRHYTINLEHWEEEEGEVATVRAVIEPHGGPSHVFVGRPGQRACYVRATVLDDAGQVVEGAEVNWIIEPSSPIEYEKCSANAIRVTAKPIGDVGPAKILAQYADAIKEMVIYCYGWFALECGEGQTSSGWSMDAQGPGGDLSVTYASPGGVTINAPYGVARVAEPSVIREDAFFERFAEPPTEGYVTATAEPGVYDIISSSGTHYKLALGMLVYTSGRCEAHFVWDRYR